VISQDTSAYGVDLKYRTGPGRPPVRHALHRPGARPRRARRLGALHYVYPYPHVDEVIPLMAEGRVLPYLDIPFQHASSPRC
jgi:ribosomal protein S12 methylthiotransferase